MVKLEQPKLEERHHDLITSIATDQKQLLELEDQILGLLNDAGSGVNVLEDEVRSYLSRAVPHCCIMTSDAHVANGRCRLCLVCNLLSSLRISDDIHVSACPLPFTSMNC